MALTNATTLANYGAGIGTQGATLTVDATNKRVGVGTDSPAGPEGSLQVGTGITFFGNTGIVSAIGGKFSGDFTVGGTLTYEDVANIDAVGIITAQSGVSIADSIFHTGDDNTAIRFPAADTFTVETSGSEALRVDSSQQLLLGTTSSFEVGSSAASDVQLTGSLAFQSLSRFSANGAGPNLIFGKSRNASPGSYTVVQDDDDLGNITFAGDDGTDLQSVAARIVCEVDGTPGSNDMPGRLTFHTTADGASSPTEALRIDSSGRMGLGVTSPDGTLTISATASNTPKIRLQSASTDNDAALSSYADANGTYIALGSNYYLNSSGNGAVFDTNDRSAAILMDGRGSGSLQFLTGNTGVAAEGMRLDSAGRLIISATTARTNFNDSTIETRLQIEAAGDNDSAALSIISNAGTTNSDKRSGLLVLGRTRGTSNGSNTVVVQDDQVGMIEFKGMDGTSFTTAALIKAQVDAAVGTDDMPGRLVFGTTADGAATPTERLRIDSSGDVHIGDSSSNANGHGLLSLTQNASAAFNALVIQQGNTGFTATDGLHIGIDAGVDAYFKLFENRDFIFYTGTTNTERLRIDSSGQVGIAEDNPEAPLHIGASDSWIDVGAQSGNRTKLGFNNNITYFGNSSSVGQFVWRNNNTRAANPWGSGTELMRVDTSGRLLLGVTSSSGNFRAVFEGNAGNAAAGGDILLCRGQSTPLNGQNLGLVGFGDDTQTVSGQIQAFRDSGTWSSSSKPTAIRFSTTTDGASSLSERMRVDSSGNTMFGTTNNAVATQNSDLGTVVNGGNNGRIYATASAHHDLNRTSDGEIIRFRSATNTEGSISVSGSTVTYGEFCGSHWGRLEDSSKPEILPGTILETINKSIEWKVIEFTVDGVQKLQAYNGSEEIGASVTVEYEGVTYTGTVADEAPDSDALNKHVCVKVSDTAASKAVFGVFLGWDEGEDDKMIGIWNDMNIAAIGNYFIRIKSGQSLEIGDLIESDGTGCGVVQSDDIIRSKTVAKVTSTTSHKVYTDGSFLVTCVLYSG